MRIPAIIPLVLLACIALAQTPNAAVTAATRDVSSEDFTPVNCFAGQVRIRNRRLARQSFSVFNATNALQCCGTQVASGKTDIHGHFFVEPLAVGRYFAEFAAKDGKHQISFAIRKAYLRCSEVGRIEVNLLNPKKRTLEEFVDINDSGEPCIDGEPQCFRN
jgi:hypothetical protein